MRINLLDNCVFVDIFRETGDFRQEFWSLHNGWKRLLSSSFPNDSHYGRFNGSVALWKTLHPSEDGEALQTGTFGTSSAAAGRAASDTGIARAASSWFAVYTTSRHEKRVAQHFDQRGIEHYLPLYRFERKWRDGSKVTLDLPLFPSYIFVRMERMERGRVLSVPGALSVVGGTGREAAPLPDAAIEALRAGMSKYAIEPHSLLTIGKRVRIRSGAFAGMEGVVARKRSRFRVVLTLQQIMQSIAIEVDEDDVELVGMPSALYAPLAGLRASCLQGARPGL